MTKGSVDLLHAMNAATSRTTLAAFAIALAVGIASAILLFEGSATWLIVQGSPTVWSGGPVCAGTDRGYTLVDDGNGYDPWTGSPDPMVVRDCSGQLQTLGPRLSGAAIPLEIGFLPGFIGSWWLMRRARRWRLQLSS